MSASSNVNMAPSALQDSKNDVNMQDSSSEGKKVKDLAQQRLGVSRPIAKPKREKPKTHTPAVQARVQPSQRPPSQLPQPVGLSMQDEEDGELLGRLGGLRV